MYITNKMVLTASAAVNLYDKWNLVCHQNPYKDAERKTAWRKIAFTIWSMRFNFTDTSVDMSLRYTLRDNKRRRVNG